MGIKTVAQPSYSPDLAPLTFGNSLSSEAVVMRQLMRWDCDEGHWHTNTRGLRWGLPEGVGMVQQVHCSRRILLRRGLEFHVCTINKSVHKKKSLENYLMILVAMSFFGYLTSCDITKYQLQNKINNVSSNRSCCTLRFYRIRKGNEPNSSPSSYRQKKKINWILKLMKNPMKEKNNS